MAYDKEKAHEYYVKYRKKGLKKGRKKGSSKKSSESIVGLSTAGLNDAGKMEVALLKQDLKKQMNTALSKATTDEEKAQIRREYQQKALEGVQKIKGDSQYAKPKAQKAAKATSAKASKSSGSSGSNKKFSGSSGSSKASSSANTSKAVSEAMQKSLDTLTLLVTGIAEKIAKMTDDQKTETKTLITDIIAELQKQVGTNVDITKIQEQLEEKLKV